MANRLIWFLIMCVLFACKGCAKRGAVDPSLKSYVDAFRRDFPHTPTDGITVEYSGALKREQLATCTGRTLIRVTTRPNSFGPDRYSLEQTIYHELGHCALGLQHYDDAFDIMNSVGMRSPVWETNRKMLIRRLKDRIDYSNL